jgi:hypothetical protein
MHRPMVASIIADAIPEDVVANSFKDLHVKGFNYVCLHRSPKLTLKLYTFDGDISQSLEVVNPHDHAYDFQTYLLAGEMHNDRYELGAHGSDVTTMHRFMWQTPLNGGNGFTWQGTEDLLKVETQKLTIANSSIWQNANDIHTIRIVRPRTALLLIQGADRPDIASTNMYSVSPVAPSVDKCYNAFTVDEINKILIDLGFGELGARKSKGGW